MSHLLCHRSVYNGHLRGPVTPTHCWALSSGDVTTYFNNLGQSWTRFELQTFRMLGTLSDRLRHRRDLRIFSRTFSKSIFFISAPLTCAHSILCSWNIWYRISFIFKTILTSITKQLFEKLTKIVVNLRNINDTSITLEYKMLKKKPPIIEMAWDCLVREDAATSTQSYRSRCAAQRKTRLKIQWQSQLLTCLNAFRQRNIRQFPSSAGKPREKLRLDAEGQCPRYASRHSVRRPLVRDWLNNEYDAVNVTVTS